MTKPIGLRDYADIPEEDCLPRGKDVPPPPIEEDYVACAHDLYACDDIEIDEDRKVSIGEDGGWVRAWLFVSKYRAEEMAAIRERS